VSRHSVVDVVTRLRAGRSGVRIPAGATDFLFLHNVQTIPRAHRASYLVGTGGAFPRVERPGCEADYSPVSAVVVKAKGFSLSR
jgi:hypothetical protein